MNIETKHDFANLLRAAASQAISETEFWEKLKNLEAPADDPMAKIAYEGATHFWGNFHERNLLFMRSKPDRYTLQQGREQLNLIAEALDGDWLTEELERKLDDL
jgi:hypothetical protein